MVSFQYNTLCEIVHHFDSDVHLSIVNSRSTTAQRQGETTLTFAVGGSHLKRRTVIQGGSYAISQWETRPNR
jgi:hypothetical protein